MSEDCEKANIIPAFQRSKNILIDKLRRCGLDRKTLRWIENWLNGRCKRLVISDTGSNWRRVTSSVFEFSTWLSILTEIILHQAMAFIRATSSSI